MASGYGAAAAPGASGGAGQGALVVQAQERLRANRSASSTATINMLKTKYGLGEEVELALRMLPSIKLQGLVAKTVKNRAQLNASEDKSATILSFVSELDPDVEALVRGLLALEAEGAGEEAQTEDVVAKAQARLQANKGRVDLAAIQRLKADCGLSDEVELAIRMLSPEHLREVMAGWVEIKRKVAEKKDGGKFMLSIISQLDPEVEALVGALVDLDAQGTEPEVEALAAATQETAEAAGGSGGEADADAAAVAAAKARLQAPKTPAQRAAIQRLKAACGLGDEVELALRMLSSAHLAEIIAGEGDITRKAQAEDGSQIMMWLISQLDPDVEQLVQKLLEMEGRGSGAAGQEKEPDDTAGQTHEEAIAEAQRRMHANQTAQSVAAIQNFRSTLELGDEVELALRMLSAPHLWKIVARKFELKKMLPSLKDKNKHVLDLVSELDPTVEALVRRFVELDRQAAQQQSPQQQRPAAGASAGGNGRSRSPPRGKGAAAGKGAGAAKGAGAGQGSAKAQPPAHAPPGHLAAKAQAPPARIGPTPLKLRPTMAR